MAQGLAETARIDRLGHPVVHVVEDFSLDVLIQAAQVFLNSRIVLNRPDQGSFAFGWRRSMLVCSTDALRLLGDLPHPRNDRREDHARVGSAVRQKPALPTSSALRYLSESRW